MPETVQDSYTEKQRLWLWNLEEFIRDVETRRWQMRSKRMGERRNKLRGAMNLARRRVAPSQQTPLCVGFSCTEGSMMKKPKSPGRPARPVVTLPATAEEIRPVSSRTLSRPNLTGSPKIPKPTSPTRRHLKAATDGNPNAKENCFDGQRRHQVHSPPASWGLREPHPKKVKKSSCSCNLTTGLSLIFYSPEIWGTTSYNPSSQLSTLCPDLS